MFRWERKFLRQGHRLIAGVDEAGRGPLAGPVVAAAVVILPKIRKRKILFPKFENKILDSKKLTPWQREAAFQEICKKTKIGIGIVNERLIDLISINQATIYAMESAIQDLRISPDHILIDGVIRFPKEYRFSCLLRGETQSISIACASIVAKVLRDKIMEIYDRIYPNYFFKSHKGYGTTKHLQLLKIHGPSPIHRKTFKPLRNRLQRRKFSG